MPGCPEPKDAYRESVGYTPSLAQWYEWGTLGRSWVAVAGLGYLLIQGPVDGTDYVGRRKDMVEGWLKGANLRKVFIFLDPGWYVTEILKWVKNKAHPA